MDTYRIIDYAKQVEDDEKNDKEEKLSKKDMLSGTKSDKR